eukprot:845455-Prorocentrum_minimum.AAC.8
MEVSAATDRVPRSERERWRASRRGLSESGWLRKSRVERVARGGVKRAGAAAQVVRQTGGSEGPSSLLLAGV